MSSWYRLRHSLFGAGLECLSVAAGTGATVEELLPLLNAGAAWWTNIIPTVAAVTRYLRGLDGGHANVTLPSRDMNMDSDDDDDSEVSNEGHVVLDGDGGNSHVAIACGPLQPLITLALVLGRMPLDLAANLLREAGAAPVLFSMLSNRVRILKGWVLFAKPLLTFFFFFA
jgi:hypothetical protein